MDILLCFGASGLIKLKFAGILAFKRPNGLR